MLSISIDFLKEEFNTFLQFFFVSIMINIEKGRLTFHKGILSVAADVIQEEAMISDYHLHSNFSGDSEALPEAMIQQAIRLGMSSMCFTDHYDMDYPDEPELFLFHIDTYFQKLSHLKEQYQSQIEVRIGIELGLQKHLQQECSAIAACYPFDFIIGSSHVVNQKDPYYPSYFEGHSEEECYQEYFDSILDNLDVFQDFDVYGHIDYIVRYGPDKNKYYSYEKYQDVLDKILKTCIEKGIGLELNTGGLAYGLGHPNPHPDIIHRYRQLGGEIITVGSDAHAPDRLGGDFSKAVDILQSCGFTYYTVFRDRTPTFIRL